MAEARLRALLIAVLLAAPAASQAASPMAVEEVASGVFVHQGVHEDFTPENQGGIANIGFVVGKQAVAVIDSGGSPQEGRALLAAIRARTELPIAYVINTHAHPDHVLGNAAFRSADVTFVGHARLPRAMAERGPHYLANMERLMGDVAVGSDLIPPDLLVEDTMTLDLGGRDLRLSAWPTAHTDCDLTVLDAATSTLFAGDLVFMERIPVVDGSLLGWLAVADQLAAIDAAQVVPGHGPARAPWPQALAAQRVYLTSLRDRLRAALADNVPLSGALEAVPMDGSWRLAEENHPRNVMAGYTELEWE